MIDGARAQPSLTPGGLRDRALAWLAARTLSHGPAAALVFMLTAVMAASLHNAGWVRDDSGLTAGAWLGVLFGAALAASRFGGWYALGYTLVLAAAAAIEAVGRILPAPDVLLASSSSDVIWGMHVRLLTLGYRVNGWAEAIARREPIVDSGLFVAVIVLVAWCATGWLIWSLARRRNALAGLLPYGALLAINIHLSGQSLNAWLAFLVIAMLLMALTSHERQHIEWERRQVDYPEGLGLAWAGSALALAAAVGLLARASPLIGTPEGWQVLSGLVASSRQRAAETAGQLFAGVNPPEAGPLFRATVPELGVIGAPPDQRADTVFWVRLSDPAPRPAAYAPAEAYAPAPPQHYWRSALFATYRGTGWAPAPLADADPAAPPDRAGRYALVQQFEIEAPVAEELFAANSPISATEGVRLWYSRPDNSPLLRGTETAYEVVSLASQVTARELAASPAVYPDDIRAAYLQLPDSLPERVRSLAADITAGASTAYDKAVRLESFLRSAYAYTLDVPPPPPGRDAVDYFLFEAPGGFCSYSASALAVMLRAVDVPARVAVGYAMGEYDQGRGAYRVPASAAHAWVEVYFPGYGWVEFEPTPVRSLFDYGSADAARPAGSEGQTGSAGRPAGLGQATQFLAGLAVLALAAVLGWLLRGHIPAGAARTPRDRAGRLYWSVRGALARAGLKAPPSVTPGEFLLDSEGILARRPALWQALRRATAVYLSAMFSPRPVTPADAQDMRRLWARARGDWLRLVLAYRLGRRAPSSPARQQASDPGQKA